MTIGIYKFTNKINKKSYIGQSINIERRKEQHLCNYLNKKTGDYNCQFHQAIRKYGFYNFDFEILEKFSPEEFSKEELNYYEIYYIDCYNSYKNGYNATLGGTYNNPESIRGEKNGRALLKEKDVIYIRECYNAHIPFREVYKEFKNKISKRGLQKIWYFETWKNICQNIIQRKISIFMTMKQNLFLVQKIEEFFLKI